MGGAIETARESAFAFRDAKYLVQIGSWFSDTCPSEICDRVHRWLRAWWNESVPLLIPSHTIPSCYRNYEDLELGKEYAKGE